MAVISGVVLITYKGQVGGGGGRVATGLQLEKRHSEAPLTQAISQTSHHTSHKPQQKMNLTCRKRSGSMPSYQSLPEVPHHLCWPFSVLYGQKNGSRVEKQTWPSLVIYIQYEYIYLYMLYIQAQYEYIFMNCNYANFAYFFPVYYGKLQ